MKRRILFFYTEPEKYLIPKEQFAWKNFFSGKRNKRQQSLPDTKILRKEFPMGELELYYLGIPEKYQQKKNRSWNLGMLLDYLQRCCIEMRADAYYLESSLENILPQQEHDLPKNEKQMEPILLQYYLSKFRCIDSVILLGDAMFYRGENLFPESLLRHVHYFTIVSEHQEAFDSLEEVLWNQYGMPVQYLRHIPETQVLQVKRQLIIDNHGEMPQRRELLHMPKGSIYLDLWSQQEKRDAMRDLEGIVRYYSEYEFLEREATVRGTCATF